MQIHAVLITHSTRELTDHCLCHLSRELAGIDSMITVVDNASVDDTCLMLRSKHPGVRLLANERNLGFAAACNLAIFSAPEAEYDLFVNSDTEPASDVVAKMHQYMNEHPDCAALGCRLTNWDGTPQHSFANGIRFASEFFGKKIFSLLFPNQFPSKRQVLTQPIPVESLVGAFFMVRRRDFMAARGFDERYFFFLEETDLCRRFWEMGRKVIFHPDFIVKHKQGASANKNPKWARHQFYRSKYQFLLQWEKKKICLAVYIKNFFFFTLKSLFYFLIHTLTLRVSSRLAIKEEISFWLWRHHFLGFPPFLDLSKTNTHKDRQGNCIFSFLVPEENAKLLCSLTDLKSFQFIKQSKVATTIKLAVAGLSSSSEKHFCLKIEKHSFLNIFKSWINRGFGRLNFKNSLRLQSVGISVPAPIAWGIFRNSFWGRRKYFFLNTWESETVVLNFFEEHLRERFQGLEFLQAKRALIQQLALNVRGLHDCCVFQHDLKASNILLDLKSVTLAFRFRFVLVDLEKISYGYFFNARLALKNLVQLNKSFTDFSKVSFRERLRFLSVYLGHSISHQEKRLWLSKIVAWTGLILKRKWDKNTKKLP